MAVLQDVPGLRVTVECNGNTLEEYHDEDEFVHEKFQTTRNHVSTKYIECVTDTEFQVKFDIEPAFRPGIHGTHTTVWLDVDGKTVSGYDCTNTRLAWSKTLGNVVELVGPNEASKRNLKFCGIKKIDDADSNRVKSDIKLVHGLGEILVHIHSTVVDERGRGNDYQPQNRLEGISNEISEKALKGQAISHGVSFGPEQRVYYPQEPTRTYPYGYNNPLAIFRFKYRSREALQQELIIPRSPSPEMIMLDAQSPERRISNQERLAQLKREMEQIKSEVKKEEEQSESSTPKGRKRPSDDVEIITSGRVYKTIRHTSGATMVDLTGDD